MATGLRALGRVAGVAGDEGRRKVSVTPYEEKRLKRQISGLPVDAVIHWELKQNGWDGITHPHGHGEPIDYEAAEAWVRKLNIEHPQIHHYLKPL